MKEVKSVVEKEDAAEAECLSFSAPGHWFWLGLVDLSKELHGQGSFPPSQSHPLFLNLCWTLISY